MFANVTLSFNDNRYRNLLPTFNYSRDGTSQQQIVTVAEITQIACLNG